MKKTLSCCVGPRSLACLGGFSICLTLQMFFPSGAANAYSTGIVGVSGAPGDGFCNECHSGGATPTTTLAGPTEVVEGTTNAYSLTVTGGAASHCGLNVRAYNGGDYGTLIAGSGSQVFSSQLTHTTPKAFSSGSCTFDFQWLAPTVSSNTGLTLYGAGNSVNRDFGTSGDLADADTHPITVYNSPVAPTSVTASDGTSTAHVAVSWSAASGPSSISYRVYRCTSSSTGTCGSPLTTTTSTSYNDTGASLGVQYYYRVRTSYLGVDSALSTATDTGFRRPSPPATVTASDGTSPDHVAVAWSSVTGATDYRVYRCTSSSTGTCGSPLTTIASTSYNDTGAAPGVTYYYRVTSRYFGVESDFSSADSGFRPALDTPYSGQVPIPDYTSTFSDGTRARGFYFQAPVDLTLTGVRVPDEVGHGRQNVEIFVMDSAPPSYPATGSGGLVYRAIDVPSEQVLETIIAVRQGQYVGVLGAAGDGTVMHNSYGSTSFDAEMVGTVVPLTRFLVQNNLVPGATSAYSGEPGGSIGRVELYYTATPLPAFTSTFSDAGLTSGYYFQAPGDFVITGLRVPDETANGTQNVEVFVMNTSPPAFPSSASSGRVFRSVGVPSSEVIPTYIPVTSGQYVGILGAAGTATMHNSYGDAGPSEILGSSVTLTRFLTQNNIAALPAPDYSQGVGSIGRVELHYRPSPTLPSGVSIAQPPFNFTFSSASLTRGYYFRAPTEMTITGLRVPDEAAHGAQNLDVFVMDSEPPAYSAVGTAGHVFRAVGVPSAALVETQIVVRGGQYVGILGATGDSSIMNSSYGVFPFSTQIEGATVPVERFLTQNNIAIGPAPDYSSEPSGSAGRVETLFESSDPIFFDGFESGNLSSWSSAP